MSSIIRATTTSGLQVAPDNSGSLQLQTNGTTAAVTIDTSQNVGIGTTSPNSYSGYGSVTLNGTSGGIFDLSVGNTRTGSLYATSSLVNLSSRTAIPIVFETNATERMRIDSSGNVGIGITTPVYKLDINGITGWGANQTAPIANIVGANAATNGGGNLRILSNTSAAADAGGSLVLGGYYTAQTNSIDFAEISGRKQTGQTTGGYLIFATRADLGDETERMRITSGGEVYIAGTTDRGAFNLQCNGTGVWGAGAYTNGSDERIKNNITPLDTGLDVVAKLNPVTYTYKEDWSKDQSIQTGFIAQDLLVALEGKNYVDGIVNQSSEYMSVAYQNIIPILTKAIQEQQTIINDLKARIETLEAK
jgi:hypothetical protein